MTTTPAEQEVTNLPPCPFCGREPTLTSYAEGHGTVYRVECECDVQGLQNSAIDAIALWSRRAAAAEGQAAAWDEAIKLVKGLLPELERVNKVELEHGFIGTSYELGQTKDIIELLEAARDASPPTAPHEPHGFVEPPPHSSIRGLCWKCRQPREAHQVSAPQREGECEAVSEIVKCVNCGEEIYYAENMERWRHTRTRNWLCRETFAAPPEPAQPAADPIVSCRGNETGYHTCGLPIGGCGKNRKQSLKNYPPPPKRITKAEWGELQLQPWYAGRDQHEFVGEKSGQCEVCGLSWVHENHGRILSAQPAAPVDAEQRARLNAEIANFRQQYGGVRPTWFTEKGAWFSVAADIDRLCYLLEQYIAAALPAPDSERIRDEALETAAAICDTVSERSNPGEGSEAAYCALQIRARKGTR